jgi:hypothetical protein
MVLDTRPRSEPGAPYGTRPSEASRLAGLERELAEARGLLRRLLEAEERIGLAYVVMDDARRFLARRRPS